MNRKGFVPIVIFKVVVILLIIGGIVYGITRVMKTRAPNFAEGEVTITILSPNGGEVWRFGESPTVKWDIFSEGKTPPAETYLEFLLESVQRSGSNGPLGGTKDVDRNSFTIGNIQQLLVGDTIIGVSPGEYRLRAILYYDRELCREKEWRLPDGSVCSPQILTEDRSDASFSILP